jgi:hypothetical protein
MREWNFLFGVLIIFMTEFIKSFDTKLILLDSVTFYHLFLSHQNNDDLSEQDLDILEYNFLKRRNSIQAPDHELLSFYHQDVIRGASKIRNSSIYFDIGPVWAQFMEGMLILLSTPELVNKLDRYMEMSWSPHLFSWYFMNSETTAYFEQNGRFLQSHPLWDSLWHRALTTSFSYMHARVPISIQLPSNLRLNNYDEPVHPGQYFYYRAEAIQLVYNHMILQTTLGLLPHQLSQVIEFGGGTGLHSALLPSLGFNGIHFVYDLSPMVLLQQFFLSYSGWPAYLGEKLYEADMRNLGNLKYEAVSSGKNLKGRQIILGTDLEIHLRISFHCTTLSLSFPSFLSVFLESNLTHLLHHLNISDLSNSLFFASHSISETPLHIRDAFMSPFLPIEMRFGFYFLQLGPEFASVNNLVWIHKFAQSIKSTHNSCCWKNQIHGGSKSISVTFVAKRIQDTSTPQDEDLIYCLAINLCLPSDVYFCNMMIASN